MQMNRRGVRATRHQRELGEMKTATIRGGASLLSTRLDAALQRAMGKVEHDAQHGTVKHWVRGPDGQMVKVEDLNQKG